MRNIPYTLSLREAHKTVDFSKLVKYGDIWTPFSLTAGDVMRADLQTYYKYANHGRTRLGLDAQQYYDSSRNGFTNFNFHAGLYDPDSPVQLMPRNTIVLGFDFDLETYDIRYVRLAKFSYNVDDSCDPIVEPQFWPDEIGHFVKPVVFRGRQINFAAFDTEAIGRLCDKTGTITNPNAIKRIQDALIGSEDRRSYLPKDLEGTVFVPSIDPRNWKDGIDFDLIENDRDDYKGISFFDLDEASQDKLIEDALWVMAERLNVRRHQFFHEKDHLFQAERRVRRKTRESVRRNAIRRIGLDKFDSKTRRDILGSVIDDISISDKSLVDQFADIESETELPDIKLASGKRASVQTLLARAAEKYQDDVDRKQRIFQNACKGRLTEELRETFETVGIGGLRREPNIEISGPLFRWRFLMMRVPDLHDPSNYSDTTYRPCVVWNGFWSLDEEGKPELAGLELYPCTRHAENFAWKMGIQSPLKTFSERSTHLIPELLVRAPINSQYFQPNQPPVNGFANLDYRDRAAFEAKLEIFEQREGQPKIWGLQERPEHWLPIEDESFFTLPENDMRFANQRRRGNGFKHKKQGSLII